MACLGMTASEKKQMFSKCHFWFMALLLDKLFESLWLGSSFFSKHTSKNVRPPITYETETESASLVCIITLALYIVFCWLFIDHVRCEDVRML